MSGIKFRIDYMIFGGLALILLLSILTSGFLDPTIFNQLYPSLVLGILISHLISTIYANEVLSTAVVGSSFDYVAVVFILCIILCFHPHLHHPGTRKMPRFRKKIITQKAL